MSITTQNWDAGTTIPSGWVQDSGGNYTFAADGAAPSQPNDLQCGNSFTSPSSLSTIYYASLDGAGGNVIVKSAIALGSNNGHGDAGIVFGRCTASPQSWTSITCYGAFVTTTGVLLGKQVAGTFTQIGSTVSVSLTVGHFYLAVLTLNGTTIQVALQDLSNSEWLTSGGTWQSGGQVNCISQTDSSISGQGYAGIATYTGLSSASPVYKYDNFELDAFSALTAGTLSATIASSTSVSLSVTSATGGTSPYDYQFQRAPDVSGSPGSYANVGPNSTATSYTDTGLTTRTKYWYRCVVTDSASSTADSNAVSIVPDVATTYYIAAAGSDSNNGTSPSTPWQTIGKVNNWPGVPGDSYLFNGGDTFSGNLAVSTSGTQAARITYSSYGTGMATINGGNGTGVQVLNAEFVTVSNLIVTGSGVSSDGTTTSTGVGIEFLSNVSSGSKWRSVYVLNCTVSGTHDGIWIHTPVQNTGSVVGYADVKVVGCTVHDYLVQGIVVWGSATDVSFGNGNIPTGNTTFTGVYIADNVIYNGWGDPTTNVSIINQPIAIWNTQGGLCERNVIYNCGSAGPSSSTAGGVGAMVFLESDRIVGQWNEAYLIHTNLSYDGCAFDMDGGATNCVMRYNYSHDNDGAGYQTGQFSGSHSTTGNVFHNNISRNDCRKNAQGALFTFGGSGSLFANNTVYLSATGAASSPPAVNLGGGSGHKFVNNILVTTGGLALGSGTAADGTFTGNLYWSSGGSFSLFGSSTLSAWQGTGQETANGIVYGVNADPLLSNPTAGAGTGTLPGEQVSSVTYFDLQSGSPAIGAGVDLSLLDLTSPPVDFHGYPLRANSGVDIGACTHGAKALVPGIGTGGNSMISPFIQGSGTS